MPFTELVLAAALAVVTAVASAAHDSDKHVSGPADGYVYRLAAPGTYRLPVIKEAGGGAVLDHTGARRELRDLLTGRFTILAFVYTRCGDLCPLATLRLAQLRDLLGPSDADRLRLITLSFDPDHDTPQRMAEFAAPWRDAAADARVPWLFLTTPSRFTIAPLLAAYNQPVAPRRDSNDAREPIGHLMRVFLIDEEARIRNIYSPDFLDPRLMLNDIRTLAAPAN